MWNSEGASRVGWDELQTLEVFVRSGEWGVSLARPPKREWSLGPAKGPEYASC